MCLHSADMGGWTRQAKHIEEGGGKGKRERKMEREQTNREWTHVNKTCVAIAMVFEMTPAKETRRMNGSRLYFRRPTRESERERDKQKVCVFFPSFFLSFLFTPFLHHLLYSLIYPSTFYSHCIRILPFSFLHCSYLPASLLYHSSAFSTLLLWTDNTHSLDSRTRVLDTSLTRQK